VRPGRLSLAAAIERLTAGPARAFGLAGGTLAPGAPADLTLIDLETAWRVDPSEFASLSRNTPFAGRALHGRATAVIVGGEIRFRDGEFFPAAAAAAASATTRPARAGASLPGRAP